VEIVIVRSAKALIAFTKQFGIKLSKKYGSCRMEITRPVTNHSSNKADFNLLLKGP